jgi:hypothetical protein
MKLTIIAIVAVIYGIIISIPNAYIQSVLADSSSSSHDSGKGGGKSDDNKGKSDDNKGKSDDNKGKSDDNKGKSDDGGGSTKKCKSCDSESSLSSQDGNNENQGNTAHSGTFSSTSGSTARQLQNIGPTSSQDGNNENQGNTAHSGTFSPATDALRGVLASKPSYEGPTVPRQGPGAVKGAEDLGQIPGSSGAGNEPQPKFQSNIITDVTDAQAAKEIPGSSGAGNELQNTDPNSNPNNPLGATSGTQLTNSPFAAQSTNTTNETSSRDELLDKVSTPEELHTILTKFRNFIDDTSVNSVVNSSLGKVSTTPTNSYGVSYSWEPTNTIMKEEHFILMLKFTDAAGNIIKNSNIDYNILIKDPNTNNSVFQKHGSTPTGVDLKIIDGNSFPTAGSQSNRIDYNVEVVVNSVGSNIASEHASLSKVAVMSYNQ